MQKRSGNVDQLLRLIQSDPAENTPGFNEQASHSASGSANAALDDANLLDAYSQAVVRVVETVGRATIGVMPPRNQHQGGQGSGFVITPDGYALTNSHVVAGRDKLTATTQDGDRLDAEVVGDDPATDLALLRLAARSAVVHAGRFSRTSSWPVSDCYWQPVGL